MGSGDRGMRSDLSGISTFTLRGLSLGEWAWGGRSGVVAVNRREPRHDPLGVRIRRAARAEDRERVAGFVGESPRDFSVGPDASRPTEVAASVGRDQCGVSEA